MQSSYRFLRNAILIYLLVRYRIRNQFRDIRAVIVELVYSQNITGYIRQDVLLICLLFVKTLPIVEGHGDYNMVFFFWDKVPVTRDELSEIGVPLCWCGYDMSMQLETDFSYDGRSGAYFLARVVDKIRDRLEPDWSAPWIPTFTDDFKL